MPAPPPLGSGVRVNLFVIRDTTACPGRVYGRGRQRTDTPDPTRTSVCGETRDERETFLIVFCRRNWSVSTSQEVRFEEHTSSVSYSLRFLKLQLPPSVHESFSGVVRHPNLLDPQSSPDYVLCPTPGLSSTLSHRPFSGVVGPVTRTLPSLTTLRPRLPSWSPELSFAESRGFSPSLTPYTDTNSTHWG